jgi:hypothetical protein
MSEQRLRTLEDRQAILDCIYRVARGLDRHDREIVRSAFHDDAAINISDFVGTLPEFLEWSRAGHEKLYGGHTHNITNHNCSIEGDSAHAESYVIMVLRHRDDSNVTVSGGRYIDRLERRGGEWRIALRRFAPDWRFTADGSVWNPDRPGIPFGTRDRSDISYDRPLALPPALQARLKPKGGA